MHGGPQLAILSRAKPSSATGLGQDTVLPPSGTHRLHCLTHNHIAAMVPMDTFDRGAVVSY